MSKQFYKFNEYYTHSTTQDEMPELSLLQRLRNHLAWRFDRGVSFTEIELGPPNKRSLCDVGCGNGILASRLKDYGFSVIGIEPDPTARVVHNRRL